MDSPLSRHDTRSSTRHSRHILNPSTTRPAPETAVFRPELPVVCAGPFVGGGILITVVTVVIVAVLWRSWFNRTLTERLDQIVPQQANTFQTTRIYDRTGNELWQVFDEGRRTRIRLSDVSPYVIDATIAVEDATFYENPGVDLNAIGRAGSTTSSARRQAAPARSPSSSYATSLSTTSIAPSARHVAKLRRPFLRW